MLTPAESFGARAGVFPRRLVIADTDLRTLLEAKERCNQKPGTKQAFSKASPFCCY